MGTIDYNPLDEEEAFTATSLNAGFTELEDGINDIDMDAVKRHSLRSEHQPSLTPAVEHPALTWTKELTGTITPAATGEEPYGYKYYDTTNTVVVGPEGALQRTLNLTLGMGAGTNDRIGALLVLANVRIGMMYQSTQYTTHNNLVVLTIQVQDSTGWHDINRTRRSLSQPDRDDLGFDPIADDPSDPPGANTWAAIRFKMQVDFDIPLRTLIGPDDIPDGSGTILGVRVVIRGATAPTGLPTTGEWVDDLIAADDSAYYTTGQANLSIIPFHALAVMS